MGERGALVSYGSRKFLLALLVIGIGTGMSYVGLLEPQLVDLFKWVTGLYYGFNVTQKASEWISVKLTTPKEAQ